MNLQTLGTLINVDLPWNPARLEQRLGRIRRFGQARKNVDMLNLVYHETQDEKIYRALSQRLKDTYDIFGNLPDTIEDDWIENETAMIRHMDIYIHERKKAQKAFSLKYEDHLDPRAHLWERCAEAWSLHNGQMRLHDAGEIVAHEWIKTAEICDAIELDEWVVMPNHFHGIFILSAAVGAIHESPLHMTVTQRRNDEGQLFRGDTANFFPELPHR